VWAIYRMGEVELSITTRHLQDRQMDVILLEYSIGIASSIFSEVVSLSFPPVAPAPDAIAAGAAPV
jgi:hypothetical protein